VIGWRVPARGASAFVAMSSSRELKTEYEAERDARVARNRAMMQSLGIHTNDILTHSRQNEKSASKVSKGATGASDSNKRKTPSAASTSTSTAPARRSKRLQGAPMSSKRASGAGYDGADEDGEYEDEEGVALDDEETRRLHDVAAAAYARRHAGRQERASIVGTASYQHTLMRVRTMGGEALGRRINAIERAKGKHAVIKMRLFARVLFLEGLEFLAGEAAEALERLIAELGDPEAEEMSEIRAGMAADAAEAFANGDEDGVYHCDAATNLSNPGIYADVVRIEARAVDTQFVNDFNAKCSKDAAKLISPNANVWQCAAASLANDRGFLDSGNAMSLGQDGTYNVSQPPE